MLIKYEDLQNSPHETFYSIANYVSKLMGLKLEKDKIEKAINSNSFDSLKKLEEKGMFREYKHRVDEGKKFRFFNLGPRNTWQSILDESIVNEIQAKFSKEMKELNYI